jgi:cobalamin biosynthesis protein CobT
MPAEALDAHLRTTCAAIETTFEGALIAFDVKNKVPRKQAAADAQVQVYDFVTSLVERSRAMAARQ